MRNYPIAVCLHLTLITESTVLLNAHSISQGNNKAVVCPLILWHNILSININEINKLKLLDKKNKLISDISS